MCAGAPKLRNGISDNIDNFVNSWYGNGSYFNGHGSGMGLQSGSGSESKEWFGVPVGVGGKSRGSNQGEVVQWVSTVAAECMSLVS